MDFKPSKEMVRLAECVMVSMAHEDLVRPIVETYEQEILEKHQFRIDPSWLEKGLHDTVILDRKQAFLLSDDDAKVFYTECLAARDAAGLKVDNPYACPLLTAEAIRIDAENALLKEIATIPGMHALGTGFMTMDIRKRATELALRLLAPYCGEADAILKRFSIAHDPSLEGSAC